LQQQFEAKRHENFPPRINDVDRIAKKKETAIIYRAVHDLKIIRGALLLLPISYVPLISRLSIYVITQRAWKIKQFALYLSDRPSLFTWILNFSGASFERLSRHDRHERQTTYFDSLRNLCTYRRKETNIQSRRRVAHTNSLIYNLLLIFNFFFYFFFFLLWLVA